MSWVVFYWIVAGMVTLAEMQDHLKKTKFPLTSIVFCMILGGFFVPAALGARILDRVRT